MNLAVVFIHGLGLGSWVFEENFAPYFRAAGIEVHCIDLPGHDGFVSLRDRAMIGLDVCTDHCRRYLVEQVNKPFLLVGMSMGGAICQKLLLEKEIASGLLGLVLMSSVPPNNGLMHTLKLCKKLAITNPQALADFFAGRNNLHLMYSPASLNLMPESQLAEYARKIKKGFAKLEYEIFFQDVLQGPVEIQSVPMKIIGGECDLLFPPEIPQYIAKLYSAGVEILPKLGHMIPLEPGFIYGIRSIEAFISEVSGHAK